MPSPPKNGPLTFDDMLALWTSLVDPLYAQPFVADQTNSGFEAHAQGFQQLARASLAVDRTTQALYISPWSGQSDEPASGAQNAAVSLTFRRTGLIDRLLVIGTEVPFYEVAQDHGPDGPVNVDTGRRYFLLAPVIMAPGFAGPIQRLAFAEFPGRGYENPMSGSITGIQQDGGNLSNDRASVLNNLFKGRNVPDVPVPAHVGQYFRVTSGVNAGEQRRVAGYGPPDPGSNVGGVFIPDPLAVTEGLIIGSYATGEPVTLAGASVTYATGTVVAVSGSGANARVIWRVTSGDAVDVNFDATVELTGGVGGATQAPTAVLQHARLADAANTEAWRMLDWEDDWGLTVTNAESPSDGRLDILDAVGRERKIFRAAGEDDDHYRERVGQIADTVSPGAVMRAINRILAPFGLSACFREVGTSLLPGFYWDLDPYDNDFIARPQDRFRVWLSYADMRAFFMVGVPRLNWGEFGACWDGFPTGAWDYDIAWDGYAVGAAKLYQQVWQAVENARAAGVGWELYVEDLGCF